MAGYCYFCCTQNNYAQVKGGMTCTADPYAYLNDNYARTMVPLQVLAVIPVSNARLMERLMFHMLTPKRIDPKHEVFNMTDGQGGFDNALWEQVVMLLKQCDGMSQLATAAEARNLKVERQKEREDKKAMRLQQQQDRRTARVARINKQTDYEDTRLERKREKKEQREREKADAKVEWLRKFAETMESFLQYKCVSHPSSTVPTITFKQAFEVHQGGHATSENIKNFMVKKGFRWADKKVRGKAVRSFFGITLL